MVHETENWAIDFSHSKIGFSVRHFGITETEGQFKKAQVTIVTTKEDFSDVKVSVTIDAGSIDTNDVQRDTHLKSADFLDTEKYPVIHFEGERVEKTQENNYRLLGNLTIKGVTRPITMEMEFAGRVAKDPFGNTKAGLLLQGKINRKDFGVVWNVTLDHGGVAVSEAVKIYCPLQLLKLQDSGSERIAV
jgi:polyisoprenoid-binding protein YceI